MSDLVSIVESTNTLEKLQKALPRHLGAERFARIMVTEINANPDLRGCDPASFLSAMIRVAQLGLEVGKDLGQAYFIPFKNSAKGVTECNLIVGYRGLRTLALRNGKIKKIDSRCVYKGDHFAVRLGTEEILEHYPQVEPSAAGLMYVYCVVVYQDGVTQFEVMTRKQVDAIRDRGRRNPVWNSDYEEMARKTVIRRMSKALELSPELADGLRADQEDAIALPPSRTPGKIIGHQLEAAADENERLQETKAAVERACAVIRERKGDPGKILGGLTWDAPGVLDCLYAWIDADDEAAEKRKDTK